MAMNNAVVLFLFCLAIVGGEAVAVAVVGDEAGVELAVEVDSSFRFPSQRLRDAYVALQTWKQQAIFSDPRGFTADWVGPGVCNYTGVFCAPVPPGEPGAGELAVAGIDLNHGDIAGYLPTELGLLADLALLHLNSNRFCGLVPGTLRRLRLLVELDLSNNRLVGAFPAVVLDLPALRFLDLRFNDYEGAIPPEIFDRPLDAIFLNHNRLHSPLPDNFGNSPASVIVLADNHFGGCLPASLGNMSGTLNEILLINNGLDSCVPPEVGMLREVTVFDVSFNSLVGPLPQQVAGLRKVEQLDVAHNRLSGTVPDAVCALPRLKNLTISYNFFTGEALSCTRVVPSDGDRGTASPTGPRSARHSSALRSTHSHLWTAPRSNASPSALLRHHHRHTPVPCHQCTPCHTHRHRHLHITDDSMKHCQFHLQQLPTLFWTESSKFTVTICLWSLLCLD